MFFLKFTTGLATEINWNLVNIWSYEPCFQMRFCRPRRCQNWRWLGFAPDPNEGSYSTTQTL